MTKLFIGNLQWEVTKDDLTKLFSEVGAVISCQVILDRQTGRSRGFGFVEMATEEAAQRARQVLNGKDLNGRNILVKEAEPERRNGFNQHLLEMLGDFIQEKAKPGENMGFSVGLKHFTIVRDDKGESANAS